MNNEDHYFSTELDCKDELDRKINFSTVAMIMGLNVNNFILHKKESWDDYFTQVINLARNLQGMNDHYRKYIKEEDIFLTEYREKCLKNNSNTHAKTKAINLSTELDGFLTQYKAGLENLARTLNPLFNFNLTGWRKDKKDSGGKIIKSLENLSGEKKYKTTKLINFIKDDIKWVTYIVNLRDDINHYGGLKKVSDIFFDFRTKNIYPQIITHSEGNSELIRNFMVRTLNDSIDFFRDFLILSLEASALGNDMVINKNLKEDFPPYQWFIRK